MIKICWFIFQACIKEPIFFSQQLQFSFSFHRVEYGRSACVLYVYVSLTEMQREKGLGTSKKQSEEEQPARGRK